MASRSSAWRLRARHPLLPSGDHHFRFTGTSRDGHGHHQVAGIITQEAFKAAADPARFPEYGKPWQAKKLYLNVRANEPNGQGGANANARGAAGNAQTAANSAATPVGIPINVGEFDADLGRSYSQIAAEGRSLHRSQAQGGAQEAGPRQARSSLFRKA